MNQKSRRTVLTGPAELYHGGEETAGPEKVGEDKMDASACQAEEFGFDFVGDGERMGVVVPTRSYFDLALTKW